MSDMLPDPRQYEIFRAAAPLAICIMVVLLLSVLRRLPKGRRVDRMFALFVAATIGYLAANDLEISSKSIEDSIFWAKMIYVFIAFLPFLWLDFCYRFAHEGRSLSPLVIVLSLIVPVLTLVIIFVPSLSGLMWSRIDSFSLGDYSLARWSHGPWFAVYSAYTYLFFLGGAAIVIESFAHYRRYYGRQFAWLLGGIAIPFTASLIYVLRPFPSLIKDYTPVGYALGVLLFYIALYHRNLFYQNPLGRDQVVERLAEGIFVLDSDGRLSDANPAAMRILGLGEGSIGRSVAETPTLTSVDFIAAIAGSGPSDVFVGQGESQRSYRVLPSAFARGKIVTLFDQTEFHEQITRAETLAMIDELTGLPNRRRFLSEGGRELARARRRGLFVAAAMIDFDDFKGINDNHGHAAGDAVLREFGAIMSKEARADDLTCRIGGDEFAVLTISSTGAAGIRKLCERLRSRVTGLEVRDDSGSPLPVTISAGIAFCAAETLSGLDRLMADADTALYAAKRRGRNGLVVFGEDYV